MSSLKTAALPAPESPRRGLRVALFFIVMALAILVIVGATALLIFNSLKQARHDAKPVASKVTVTTFLSFPQDNTYPVGLARAADGTFYLTEFGTGAVMKSDLQGRLTPVVTTGNAISAGGSIAVATDGTVYVVDYTNKNLGSLKRIAPDGTVQPFGVAPGSRGISLFAQMTFDDQGNLYITNPSYGEVWRFDSSGNGQVWWSVPAVGSVAALPTGIAFDAARHAFIVGDSGTGTIYRVNIAENGNAGDSLPLYRASGLDVRALTLDEADRVLFVSWQHDQQNLNRLETDSTITLLANDFRDPTAIVYHDNKVYVVNSDLAGLIKLFNDAIPSPFTARPPFTIDVVSIGS